MESLEQNMSTMVLDYYDNLPNSVHQDVLTVIDTVGLPFLVLVGILTNLIAATVFASKDLRRMSSSVYLLAILVSDTGFLVSLMAPYLDSRGYNLIHRQGICLVFVSMASVARFVSTWYMLCLTVDNYIAVCYPGSMITFCTVLRARIVSLGLAVGAGLAYVSFFVVSMDSECYPYPAFFGAWPILTFLESFLSLILPSVFMVIFVVRIVMTIKQHNPSNQLRTPLNKSEKSDIRRPHARVASMLLILCMVSMAMKLPSEILRIHLSFGLVTGSLTEESSNEHIISAILLYIQQCSFAVKFFVFVSCGKNFRKVLMNKLQTFMCCLKSDYLIN